MSGLVIVAASGLATEVLALERLRGTHSSFVLVDDDEARWGTEFDGVDVVGGLTEVKAYPDHEVLVAVGKGSIRQMLVQRLVALGIEEERFARVVHPSVDVPGGCCVGAGSIVLAQAVMTADVRLGQHVVVMPHVTLTHGDRVGDFATLCAGVSLGGGVSVGEAAYLGMNSSVREGIEIGARSVVGMGAVLVQPTGAGETWAGVPARRLWSGPGKP